MAKIRVVRSPPGKNFDRVINEFSKSYEQEPFSTFLVLPNAAVRDEVKYLIAERDIPVFGASVCTVDELAAHFFDSFNHTDIQIDRYTVELIVYKILEENEERLSLFNGAWGTAQAMVPEIRAFLETLADFQVDYPQCLGDLQSVRSEQLGLIRDLYLGFLESNHMVDRGLMMKWATEAVNSIKEIEIGRVIFFDLYEPKPIEKAFINAIVGKADSVEYHCPFVAGSKAFWDEGSWLNAGKTEDGEVSNVEETLSSFYSPSSRTQTDKVVRGTFQDSLEEMRAVAHTIRQLILSGVEANSIAILLPLRTKSAPLVKEVLTDFEIPYDLHIETPFTESPLVASVFNLLEVVHYDYDRDLVARFLNSPFFKFEFAHNGKKAIINGHELDCISKEAGIIGGKETWSRSLESLATQIRDEVNEEDNRKQLQFKLTRIELMEGGIRQLFDILSKLEGNLTVCQRVAALHKILHRFELLNNLEKDDASLYEREANALRSFLSALQAMELGESIAASGEISLGEFLAKLRMLASAEGFHEAPENRNAVQVTGLRASYLMRYDHVFIVDMVDGSVPFLGASNAFIREREAARMGILSREDLLRHERFYFLSALLTSKVRTYVSRPESDDSNTLVPSFFFDNLETAFELGCFNPKETSGSNLRSQRRVGEIVSKKRDKREVIANLPISLEEVCHRIAVECDERSGEYHSPYDGFFVQEKALSELNKMLAKRTAYSASGLETYARCPFSYLMKYVLWIEPIPELEMDLTPASRGTLFHHIAYKFYSELRKKGNTRFAESQLDEMTALINDLAQVEMDNYSFSGPVWEAFRARMLGSNTRKGTLRAFLEKEATNSSRLSPKFFELSFGLPIDKDDSDPASRADPVEIDLGEEKLRLRCRIDRVDACPDGRFTVIDYKTGASAPSVASIEKGIALQLPLYIQAVEAVIGGMKGIGGAYYSVRSASEIEHKCVFGNKDSEDELKPYFGERKRYKPEFSEIIRNSNNFIASYLNSMRAGGFHPNTGPAQCPTYCEYAAICRGDGSRLGGEDDASD